MFELGQWCPRWSQSKKRHIDFDKLKASPPGGEHGGHPEEEEEVQFSARICRGKLLEPPPPHELHTRQEDVPPKKKPRTFLNSSRTSDFLLAEGRVHHPNHPNQRSRDGSNGAGTFRHIFL